MNRRRHALRGDAAFSRVFASGRRIDGTLVRCVVILQPARDPELRVGYAVSSRAYTAVLRNRLRRLMREAFAEQQESLLESLQRRGMSASIVFSFKSYTQADVRRLKVHPIRMDVSGICKQLLALP